MELIYNLQLHGSYYALSHFQQRYFVCPLGQGYTSSFSKEFGSKHSRLAFSLFFVLFSQFKDVKTILSSPAKEKQALS